MKIKFHKIILPFFYFTFFTFSFVFSQKDSVKENLNVFSEWIKWNNPGSMAANTFIRQTDKYYYARHKQIAALKTKSDWQKRQKLVREKLDRLIGDFPKKEALNPVITGVVQKDGYRIEKIIFEPIPGYYETGCLYIPDNLNGKAPAILNVFGHDQIAFREQYYQVIITNFVKKGMIVFAIDPLGQGEHVQYYDADLKFSAVGYSVLEHTYFGNICFLSGENSAKYFIWDGIRAIDYLLTRKEVDPERIGATGFSGGGTVSTYLGAFDDRVKVVVPCSWPISYETLVQTKGVQDAENTFIHALLEGITFEDLIEVRAPKPTLMTFTTRDEYMNVQGPINAREEAAKAYKTYGLEDNVQIVIDDSKHAMTPKIRLRMYSFFMKHFNLKGDTSEVKTDLPTPQELTVTPTGQIATYKGGKMVFDLNKKDAEKLIVKLEQSRKNINPHLEKSKKEAKELSGYIAPTDKGSIICGRYQRDGYTVELNGIPGERDEYAVPLLLFKPDDGKEKHPAIIYLHSQGKITEAQPGGEIEKLVKKGYIVAAADILGFGETKNNTGREYTSCYTAVLIGRSLVGMGAGDIVRVVDFLKKRDDVNAGKIGAIAFNETCLALIHAAAFDPSIQNITLINPLVSYSSVVMNRLYKIGNTKRPNADYWHPVDVDFNWGIASVLTGYDLPDLIASIAPRKVTMSNIRNSMLEPASSDIISAELEFPRRVFSSKQVSENFRILNNNEEVITHIDWGYEK